MQCRRPVFYPWVGNIPWRRERLPTPVFRPGEFHGLYSLWGCKESDTTEWLSLYTSNLFYVNLIIGPGSPQIIHCLLYSLCSSIFGFPGNSAGKEYACNAGDSGLILESGSSPGEGIGYLLQYSWAFLVAQMVKNLPAMQETWVQSLGWEDRLAEDIETYLYFCLENPLG